MLQLPEDVPDAIGYVVSAIFGAGGVAALRVWLENRRLAKKEFRETLLERVRELESVVSRLQVRMGSLRVEMAHLEVENRALREQLGLPRREADDHVDEQPPGEGDEATK